ncbi:MAG: hypothetical protein DRQ42_01620 [Gammaproteobacteria bacterium]|nr:MAG: hypothetical protein DRQ42_01620 [Gammaproteobacteria bacterium]
MRGGALASDMRAIKYLFAEGLTVAEVSKRLRICEEGLVEFAPVGCQMVDNEADEDEFEDDFPPLTDEEKREAKNAKRRAARAAKKTEG